MALATNNGGGTDFPPVSEPDALQVRWANRDMPTSSSLMMNDDNAADRPTLVVSHNFMV